MKSTILIKDNSDAEINRNFGRRLKDPVERAVYFQIHARGVIEY